MKYIVCLIILLLFSGAYRYRYSDDSVYGGILVFGNTNEDTVASGSYVQLTRFDTNTVYKGVEPDHTQDHIAIRKSGVYYVSMSAAFSGDGSVDWLGGVFVNNGATQIENLQTQRKLGAGGDIGSASVSGITTFNYGDTVEVWFRHDEGVDKGITVKDVSLSLFRL